MKNIVVFAVIAFNSILGHAKESPFFLSSDKIIHKKQASLKQLSSFVFFPLLKMEKKANQTIELLNQELKKVGVVVEKPVLTQEGVNLDTFSHPTLQFTIEQIVDQNNNLLPVLLATLSINNVVEIGKSKEFASLDTNCWSVYLQKTNDVQKAILKTFPSLLKQFMEDFQRTNTNNQKPIFYISYDSSWWKDAVQK